MKQKIASFFTIGWNKTLPVVATVLYISFPVKAQTDACAPVGWANYNNTSFAGPVTGGGAASPVTVSTIAQLKTEANATGARVIYVQGTLGAGYSNGSGERVDVKSNKTIIGFPGATVRAYFSVKDADNVIIRNLIFQGPGAQDVDGWDNMTIDNSTRVWVDHCDFRDGEDGNCDIKNGANNVSITWTKFSYTSVTQNLGALNHSFSNLIGSSDGATQDAGKLKVTFQHNWWNGAVERMPRIRYGQVHVVNNLFTEVAGFPQSKSGVTAGFDADARVESNAFIGIDDPIDVSKLAGSAKIQSINNLFSGTSGNTNGSGTAFTPPYTLTLTANSMLNTTTFKNCVGATLSAPPASSCPCSSVLPVKLIAFDIHTYDGESYLLKWLLSEDETLLNTYIEYSSDGIDFESLAVAGKEDNNYVLLSSSLPTNEVLYVRLKFTETNGNISYSPVKSLRNKNSFHLYPNPFSNVIHITGMEQAIVKVWSMEGKEVYESSLTGPVILDLSHLPQGSYFIHISSEFESKSVRMSLIKL